MEESLKAWAKGCRSDFLPCPAFLPWAAARFLKTPAVETVLRGAAAVTEPPDLGVPFTVWPLFVGRWACIALAKVEKSDDWSERSDREGL
jgi:hypothetical protein